MYPTRHAGWVAGTICLPDIHDGDKNLEFGLWAEGNTRAFYVYDDTLILHAKGVGAEDLARKVISEAINSVRTAPTSPVKMLGGEASPGCVGLSEAGCALFTLTGIDEAAQLAGKLGTAEGDRLAAAWDRLSSVGLTAREMLYPIGNNVLKATV